MSDHQPSSKAALRGEPSYVWREGQERRLDMIKTAAGERINGRILEDGCGVGEYLARLAPGSTVAVGLEIEFERAREAHLKGPSTLAGVGEHLPFADNMFDLVISHEVLEHVQDDRLSASEIVRVLKPGGRLALFVPNRGYPFETHGMYWNGRYRFGNIPLINYLPRKWRDRLAPHVNIYTRRDLEMLFSGLSVHCISRTVIASAYDNIIAHSPSLGKIIRAFTRWLECTPLCGLGLSHFWVLEKDQTDLKS